MYSSYMSFDISYNWGAQNAWSNAPHIIDCLIIIRLYPMITYIHHVASNLPIKLWLLGNCKQAYTMIVYIVVCVHVYACNLQYSH